MSVLLLCASVMLGGATRAGVIGDAILQLASVPFLLVALWLWADRLSTETDWRARLRQPSVLLGCAMAALSALILLAQLIPIFGSAASGGIWSEIARRGGEAGGPAVGTGSSSIAPDLSAAAIAAVLPALALFLLVALLNRRDRMRLAGWATLLGLVSLILGVLQVLSGPSSPLRFHWPTNTQEAVGFFANRNHFAAQMYVTLLFGIVWLTHRWQGRFSAPRFTAEKAQAAGVAVSFALLVLGVIFLTRSRAGIVIALLSIAPLVMVAPAITRILTGTSRGTSGTRTKVAAAVAILVLLIAALGAERAMPRFENSILNDLRVPILTTSLSALSHALPSGTGLGTFVPVFQAHEGTDQLLQMYVNRAHNDWIEFIIEAGLPGLLLIATFLAWFGIRFFSVWFRPEADLRAQDILFDQFSAVILLLLLLHSAVDYPLRTTTMLCYFAMCCAFLVSPPRHAVRSPAPDLRQRSTRAGSKSARAFLRET
ncbi:O-antigen ligase family protein [Aquabacter cavernae]|uniref:O-antigen ligase family protein n=1 Tax=Aquabacter cavernae TaxID=2496029 RepID=UPI000F8E43FA|nr:O-antigen ligase family protein [Aquabacter cavernae]